MPPGIRKSASLLTHPKFFKTAIIHRVAAATEHLAAIKYSCANTLLDAGANKGQFSLAFKAVRPNASIFAFEPLPEAADVYEQLFAKFSKVSLQRVALADHEGTAKFHVADRADSSSLLVPGSGQERAFGVRTARTIDVSLKRLDTCIDIYSLTKPVFLKVDVQGGELGVFEGCNSLEAVEFIYAELSFVELYERQPLFNEINGYLIGRGFAIAGIFNQVSTADYGPTQVDVLFKRA